MSALLSFRCLVTAKLLAAVLLAAAPIDAWRAANLLINGGRKKATTSHVRRSRTAVLRRP
jgi:hypothetical protein